MSKNNLKTNRGFIKLIIIIIVAIIILSYLGFDLKKLFTSDLVSKNFTYVWGLISNLWVNYLSVPFEFVWNEAIKPIFIFAWKALKSGISGIQTLNN